MSQLSSDQIENEVKAMMQRYLYLITEFIPSMNPDDVTLCDTILEDLSVLDHLCQTPVMYANRESYVTASYLLDRLRHLFQLLNQPVSSRMFQDSEIGSLWNRANDWCNKLNTHYALSDEEVWELIAPVTPDVLKRRGNNLYEAIWWKPVPPMDIEILQRTEHVVIEQPSFETDSLPGMVAICFSIQRYTK